MRGDFATAERVLLDAICRAPTPELRRTLAGVYRQTGRDAQAEAMLSTLVSADPADTAAVFGLATLLRDHGRFKAGTQVLRTGLAHTSIDAGLAIEASRLLGECARNEDALAIIQIALQAAPDDLRLHVRAAMFCMQLGKFEQARTHYLRTLALPAQACEWHVPAGLASTLRYTAADHPDFARFTALRTRTDLTAKARASLEFALGKAYDDIGDYAAAARYFRDANARTRDLRHWNRKQWRRAIGSILTARPAPAHSTPAPAPTHATPILVVGMPRSGSTLAARLLAQRPGVCNRGELPWLGTLMQHPAMSGTPDAGAIRNAAVLYAAQLQRDDSDARWFIDKQPFNFRYVDKFLAMFPHARVIHCTRGPRDVALSLWSQSFSDDILGFACDFGDIAVVMHDCERLMARWTAFYPEAIRSIRYEEMVGDPEGVVGSIAAWLGLPPAPETGLPVAGADDGDSIATASLWQARQPVHGQSIERWRHYWSLVPELAGFSRT